jgi:hypothetical protein
MNKKPKERIRFLGATGPDSGVVIKEGTGELANVVRVKDGQPISPGAHLIDIKKPGADGWSEIETLFGGDGPAQVATPAYREGYDRIFSKKQKVGLA